MKLFYLLFLLCYSPACFGVNQALGVDTVLIFLLQKRLACALFVLLLSANRVDGLFCFINVQFYPPC